MSLNLIFFNLLLGLAVLICGGVFPAASIHADEKQEVTWYHPDFPPFYMHFHDGPKKDQGIMEETMRRLKVFDPNHDHKMVPGNFTRALKAMENEEKACHSGLFKTAEREKFIDFSKPHLLILTPGLISTRSKAEDFASYVNASGEINFEALVAAQKYRISYVAGRHFNDKVNPVLEKYQPLQPDLLRARRNEVTIDQPVQMLFQDRLDGVIGYGTAALYLAPKYGNPDEIVFYPIEGAPALSNVYFGCSKGAWNKKLMATLDQFALTVRAQSDYMAFYNNWLPVEVRNRHEMLSAEYFKNNP